MEGGCRRIKRNSTEKKGGSKKNWGPKRQLVPLPPHQSIYEHSLKGEKMNQYDVIGEIPSSSLGIPPFPMYYKHGLCIGIYHLYGSYDVLLEI